MPMKSRCRNRWKTGASCSCFLLLAALRAATPGEAARAWHTAHQQEILREFTEFVAIPNFALDAPNIARNADWLVQALTRRGVSARKLQSSGAPPAIYGELLRPGATQTVMFYGHYDGQPVDASKWRVTQPWTPKIVDGRLY